MTLRLREGLARKGVRWQFQATLTALDRVADGGLLATLSTGQSFPTDLVLSAAGLIPNIAPAEKAGLAVDRGIAVDARMRASAPDVYALGHCASLDGRVFAYIEPIRRQAEAIAADLVGKQERFAPLPPLVRIKTPSLPLSVCRPARCDDARWITVDSDDSGCYLEYREDDRVSGFALCGSRAADALSLYRRIGV